MPPLAAKPDPHCFLKQKRMTYRSTGKAYTEHCISRRNAVAQCLQLADAHCPVGTHESVPGFPEFITLAADRHGLCTLTGRLSRQTPISREISPLCCLVDLRLAISQQYLHTIGFVRLQRHLGRIAICSRWLLARGKEGWLR